MAQQAPASGLTAGERLDRLPFGKFHRKILMLIGAGMFFDAMELYLAGSVLGALVKSGYSTVELNAQFISWTFYGLVVGSLLSGVLGDRYGRRFCYQLNLAIFGLASLAAAAAPSMQVLIVCRFFMGIGLGAEIVIGYGTLSEFAPTQIRGRAVAGLVYVDNLVDAALLALRHEAAAGQAFNATDGLPVTWKEFTDGLADGLGCSHARWSMPYWMATGIGFSLEHGYRLLRRATKLTTQPLLSRQAVHVLGRNQDFSNRKARELLGWEPRVDYATGLAATLDWLKAEA